MHKLLIATGSNLSSTTGTSLQTLERAIKLLESPDMRILAASRWRQSPAYPPGSGPDFVNGALLCESPRSPEAALARLKSVEAELGRTSARRWSPRVCDLDLIAWDEAILPNRAELEKWIDYGDRAGDLPPPEMLILPHPRMQERAFVLAPLADVAPDWRHPLFGKTVAEMLAALDPALRDCVTVME
jgi:2-amino-4-hydroxy-6-hydroxymethyldihydropteridine diphosphokinase